MVRVEDRLRREGAALVEIEERLMRGVVREEPRRDRYRPWQGVGRIAAMKLDGLAISKRYAFRPGAVGERMTVNGDLQSLPEERLEGVALSVEHRRVEDAIGRFDAKFVPDVEHVGHERE